MAASLPLMFNGAAQQALAADGSRRHHEPPRLKRTVRPRLGLR